ncbi:unnamed protein product [Moneuplotes crassus]|uniref:Uncharacterized protein n=1 Tax=Euplotes crassus TaxID=5936 RepID=A0AAD1UG69_EUPCR|nr:unnamed protein product [Moneuplotes crassus]
MERKGGLPQMKGYYAKHKPTKESKLNKSSSASALGNSYAPKEKWQSNFSTYYNQRKQRRNYNIKTHEESKNGSPQKFHSVDKKYDLSQYESRNKKPANAGSYASAYRTQKNTESNLVSSPKYPPRYKKASSKKPEKAIEYPLTSRHKELDGEKKIFTSSRPQLTPQAVPKSLKFRFDNKTLLSKGFKATEDQKKVKEECDLTDEENVIDDSEEQSCFVVGNYRAHKSKIKQLRGDRDGSDNKPVHKSDKQLQTDDVQVNIKEDSLINVKIKQEHKTESKISQKFCSKMKILTDFYQNIFAKPLNLKDSNLNDTIAYLTRTLHQTTDSLQNIDQKYSGEDQFYGSDYDAQLDFNKKLEASLKFLKARNLELEEIVKEKNLKQIQTEAKISALHNKNIELNELIESLKQKTDESKPNLNNKKDIIQLYKEKIQNLSKSIRMQMVSTNNIDQVRQRLSDKLKVLKNENENYKQINQELNIKVEELTAQIQSVKIESNQNEEEKLQFERTKNTYTDKDASHTDQDKASICSRHTQKIKELEKSNTQLEYEIRKMANISKQETNNLSDIINQSLDVLNDISLTIQNLRPINRQYYADENLYIQKANFNSLVAHKEYLTDKYFDQTSFTDRIKTLEEAQNRVKLLMKTIPKRSKDKLSASVSDKRELPMYQEDKPEKRKSLNKSNSNNIEELEKLCKTKDQQLENKNNQILSFEQKIKTLKRENEELKAEITELNALLSKYAAQQYLTKSPQTQSHISHFMSRRPEDSKITETNTLEKTGRDMIKEAKEQCYNKSNKKHSAEHEDTFEKADDNNSFQIDLSQSIQNPFEENNSKRTQSSRFLESSPNEDSKLSGERDNSKVSSLNRSRSRKRWNKSNKVSEKSQTKLSKNKSKLALGSDTGEDDSSFMNDFDDLMREDKKSGTKIIRQTGISNQSDFIKPEIIAQSPSPILFNFDENTESLLQIIHSVSCSLEDYFQE